MKDVFIGLLDGIAALGALRVLLGAGLGAIVGGLAFYFAPNIAAGLKKPDDKPGISIQQSGSGNIQNNYLGNSTAPQADAKPNISFPKYALFWVEVEPARYQLGIVLKLFNLDGNAHLIKGIKFERDTWSLVPRGSYYMRRYTEFPPTAEIVEDNYIKGNSEGYYKHLLPIYIELTINGGDTPDMAIKGRWTLQFDGLHSVVAVSPEFHATYEKFIASAQWQDLLKPKSTIVFEDIHFQRAN
jgi:hypothetical protein